MSIALKVPLLPFSATHARVTHWYRGIGEVIARGEVLVELLTGAGVLPVFAPHAGIVRQILIAQDEIAEVGAILAYLDTGLPNLVWDGEQNTLILDNYRADDDSVKRYEVQQMLRQGEAKFGKGFGNSLALPRTSNAQPNYGMGAGQSHSSRRFKVNPLLAKSAQFSGAPNPNTVSVPSNDTAQNAPQNAPNLGHSPQAGPSAPSPRPAGG